MNKKLIFAIVFFGILLVIFLTTEEKKDYVTDDIYWKKSIHSIKYYPPHKDWKGLKGTEYIQNEIEIIMADPGGLRNPPLFTVKSNLDGSIYEAGYNARNLFSELSVLKVKSVTDAKPNYLEEFAIDMNTSPRLEIIDKSSTVNLYIGSENKSNSLISISDGNFLLSATGYTFRRFQGKLESFRERNLVSVGNGFIEKVSWKSGNQYLDIENSPTENKLGGSQNIWRRNSGNRLVFEPRLGDDLDNSLKSIRYERFPDDDVDGLPVIQELVRVPQEGEWTIITSEGRKIKIVLYPKTLIGDKEYTPVIRTINDSIIETPAYVSHANVDRIRQSGEMIRNAIQWQRPEKKIK